MLIYNKLDATHHCCATNLALNYNKSPIPQTVLIKKELVDVHKHNTIFVLIMFDGISCDNELKETVLNAL